MERQKTGRRGFLTALAVGPAVLAGCTSGDTANESGQMEDTNGTQSGGASSRTTDVPVFGNPDAPVTFEVYEDYLCSACVRYNNDFAEGIREQYTETGQIRYESHEFPRIRDPDSWMAANAALAVFKEHGPGEYWEYKSRLMNERFDLVREKPDIYGTIAEEMGLDGGPVQTAAVERAHASDIEEAIARGEQLGMENTPGFVINDTLIIPDLDEDPRFEDFIETLEEKLDAALAEAN